MLSAPNSDVIIDFIALYGKKVSTNFIQAPRIGARIHQAIGYFSTGCKVNTPNTLTIARDVAYHSSMPQRIRQPASGRKKGRNMNLVRPTRKPIHLPITIQVTNDGFSNNLTFRDHDWTQWLPQIICQATSRLELSELTDWERICARARVCYRTRG